MNIFIHKKTKIFLFISIFLLALFLRLYQINGIPPSLNWDEVSLGYNAYTILKTGSDEWGQFLPLSFRAFGDYKLPLYIYFDVPFIKILGLNEIAVRLPSVLAGMGIVILVFFILKELTEDIYLSFFGMFISSVLPWLVIFSRTALEANLSLFLTCASFYLLLLSSKRKSLLPFSAILLGLSAFTYNSSRVLILPFIFLAITFFGSNVFKRKELVTTLIFLLCSITVVIFQALTVDSSARFRWTTILDEGAITKINEFRGSSSLPAIVNQTLFNKVTYFISEASKNYFSHFDINFLFLKGGSNFQFSIPGIGQAYLIILPLLLLGIWQSIRQRKNWQLFILAWMLVAPIPASITRDAPHSLRAIFLTIPIILLTSLGIGWIKNNLPKIFHLSVALVLLVLGGNTYYFWQNYTIPYRENYSQAWQYGYKQAVEYIKRNQKDYDRIVITKKYGEPHIFTLFYLGYDPHEYVSNKSLIRYKRSDWFWVDGFDRYEFINDWEIKEKTAKMTNTLLITSPGNYPVNSKILTSIDFLNGEKAFEIVAVK